MQVQYIFNFDADGTGQWFEKTKLYASDGAPYDYLGLDLCLSNNVLIAGTRRNDDLGIDSGSAYIFRYDKDGSGQWLEDTKIHASDGESNELIGSHVTLNDTGDLAVIGAMWDDDNGINSGSAYIFDLKCSPKLKQSGSCPGQISLNITNATKNGIVALIYGLRLGKYTIPGSICPGTIIDIKQPYPHSVPWTTYADEFGHAFLTVLHLTLPAISFISR